MAGAGATLLVQAVINGVLLGLVYTLVAVGLSVTLGLLGIVNLAHSTFIMLGTFFALELLQRAGLDPIVSMVLAVPVFFGVGWLLHRGLLRRVMGAPESVTLLVLFGLMIVLESGSILAWTTDTRVLPWPLAQVMVEAGGIVLPVARVLPALLALAMVVGLDLLLRRTLVGKAMRAVGQQPDAAAIIGIDVRAISAIVVGLATASAAVGGIALSMMFPFAPQEHIRWLAWSFLVAVFGGLGGVRGSLLGGLFVGQVEALTGVLLPFQYVYPILYGLLALTLMVRSHGLAGVRVRTI